MDFQESSVEECEKKHTYGTIKPKREGLYYKLEPLFKSTMGRIGSVLNQVTDSQTSSTGRVVPGVIRGGVHAPLPAAP